MISKAKMSESGEVLLPKALRDAYGLSPGTEIEISDDGQRIVLTPDPKAAPGRGAKKLSLTEFLALRIPYDGPPVTDAMMHEAINRAAIEDWARLERQWNGDKDD